MPQANRVTRRVDYAAIAEEIVKEIRREGHGMCALGLDKRQMERRNNWIDKKIKSEEKMQEHKWKIVAAVVTALALAVGDVFWTGFKLIFRQNGAG